MTSDAKIGLLLGLVFIFIIAFIINGLPSLRTDDNSNDLTTNSVMLGAQDDSEGIGANERRASDTFDWPEPKVEGASMKTEEAESDTSNIRYSTPLPETGFGVDDNPSDESETVTVAKGPQLSDYSLDGQNWQSVPSGSVGMGAKGPVAAIENLKSELLTAENVTIAKPVTEAKPKTYEVAKGDSLAAIAKKFYGAKEGNRLVNINRIFEANRKVLKSADVIYSGQKLVIPALPGKVEKGTAAGASGSLDFAIVKPVKPAGSSVPSAAAAGGYYEVKEGDNLWGIASERLGSGARYKEIYVLNTDVMRDEDSVVAGVRLRMPVQ
jgi:nucleoid-associated protein YgaU